MSDEKPEASGSGSGTAPTSKPAKQPKAAKAPTDGAGAKAGEKSAKDIKKEKRAAAVAARGGGEDPRAAAAAAGAGPSGSNANSNSNANPSLGQSTSSQPGGAGTGGGNNAARRPAPLLSDVSYILPPTPSHSLFFSHLPILTPPATATAIQSGKIHPLVIRLGCLMASGALRGSNARTTGMLLAFKEVIRDYESPENAVLWKDLPGHLSPMIAWLEGCRPKGAGGGNAIRWLKGEINKLGEEEEDRTEDAQKQHLILSIAYYIRDRIEYAGQQIAFEAQRKIRAGDVIMVYARSSVVERCLIYAWTKMREADPEATFEVIVVDSAPLHEGRNLLEALSAQGIPTTYTLLTSLSPLLSRTSLVLLGASALYANGSLHARAGTALVAMLAKEYRVPVVVAVETYKFTGGVRLDGLGMNEVDVNWMDEDRGTEGIVKAGDGKEGGGANLTRLALTYDLTPAEYITALCTEIGFIPPSSVPTVTGKTAAGA
ncbi:uncharacterized protein MKK02DRAFT_24331 [Dioszegia hungarica]|uniref:Translation initiation factor eIF2B subunit delta n=1 Tax=Dioszegia hungarica TaxID=4972 RepID=A0AA38HCD8_9TREE|nr:uncharacterized protein MKK02DRAFT_24331 [Dioszegia hungarica]KAI9637716.1 hypothetical protein MKK02DRAFT_24331 [Dioszegia hungarica]